MTTKRFTMGEVAGSSALQALGGFGAIVLTIIGLINVVPVAMAAASAIVIGGGMLIGSGTITARYQEFLTGRERIGESMISGGMAFDTLAGIAGIILGVLGLLGLAPDTLLPVASIVFGGALLLASGSLNRMTQIPLSNETQASHWMARDALHAASGIDLLAGAAAVVLGILALGGYSITTLTLVGFLCVGASILVSGIALTGRLIGTIEQLDFTIHCRGPCPQNRLVSSCPARHAIRA